MAEPIVSDLMAAVVEQVNSQIPQLENRITYGAPEAKPVALCVWFDYMLAEIELGLLDVALHQAIATIAVPRVGNYPLEYATVTDMQQLVRQAVRPQPFYALDATLVAIEQQPATGSGYAGEQDVLVAARVAFTLETKSEIQNIP